MATHFDHAERVCSWVPPSLVPRIPRSGMWTLKLCRPGIFSHISTIKGRKGGRKDLNYMWAYLRTQNRKKSKGSRQLPHLSSYQRQISYTLSIECWVGYTTCLSVLNALILFRLRHAHITKDVCIRIRILGAEESGNEASYLQWTYENYWNWQETTEDVIPIFRCSSPTTECKLRIKKWERRRNKFAEISKRIHRISVSLGINIEHYLWGGVASNE